MKKYNKIYMLTPAAYVTGGVEASYQFMDAINKQGGEAYIIFASHHPDPVPSEYKKYEVKYPEGIENSNKNLFVVPEIWTSVLEDPALSNIDKCIWWLSVDNNRQDVDFSKDYLHLYQSYYAKSFLENRGAKRIQPVFDYLSDQYFEETEIPKKENTICYSVKGQRIAKKLELILTDYKFIMLQNMDRSEVIDTLKKSKVFIDFGHHPGKDRIPRESAMLRNCVITNRKGSANFDLDVPILERYKIDNEDLELMVEIIKDCIENYETRIKDFESYINEIKNQKTEFFEQVKKVI